MKAPFDRQSDVWASRCGPVRLLVSVAAAVFQAGCLGAAGHTHKAEAGFMTGGQERFLLFAAAVLALVSVVSLFLRRAVMRRTAEIAAANMSLRRENSEYEEACRRLALAESRLAAVLRAARLGLWDRNIATGQSSWNREWFEMLGYEFKDIKPSFDAWRGLLHPDDKERVVGELQAHLEGRSDSYSSEYRIRSKDGSWKWVLSRGMVVERDSSGNAVRVAGIHMDIHDRKVAEEARAESDRRYRQLFEKMLDGFAVHEIICDAGGKPRDYRFLEVNPQFETITGLKAADIIGKTVREVLPNIEPRWIEIYGEVALGGEPVHFENHNAELNKTFEVTAFCPAPGQFACTFRDVTEIRKIESERREMEDRIRNAQKLESLGMLAGGIAHGFNNLLVGVLGNVELVADQVPKGSQAYQCLLDIESASRRGAELCAQMLAYSGKGRFVVERLNLNGVISGMSHLIEVSVSSAISVKQRLADDLPDVEGDASQLRQAIISLVNNAAEAIGDGPGLITIETGHGHFTRQYLVSTTVGDDLEEADYCYVDIADTGHGMDAATIARIFDPFFSTRFTGRGLGLPATLGIVRGHRGAIRVESQPGKGARFRVLLPVAPDGVKRQQAPPVQAAGVRAGMVLLVDDDETVRTVGRRILETAGFRVLLASGGRDGVDLFRSDPDGIDCVVMDLTMPGMGGDEALRLIRETRPDARVIMSSGYDAGEVEEKVSDLLVNGFVQKPYSRKQLVEAVNTVISAYPRKPESPDTASEKARKAAE